jgi:myo-inositol 2-dehydrogenase/D-chiro-inositol 1-dehydrogenase
MIGFCLVGGGFIGPLHAANIAAHPASEARLGRRPRPRDCDQGRNEARSQGHREPRRRASRPAGRRGDDLHPPRTHAAIIERVARAGKAIFCEKPVDLDLARVDACAKVLDSTGVAFFVAFNRRFDPSHRAMHDAIRAGDIGRPEMLVLSSRDPEISPPDYVAAMPFGIFYDTMIHDFDMVGGCLRKSRSRSPRARPACWMRRRTRTAIRTPRW